MSEPTQRYDPEIECLQPHVAQPCEVVDLPIFMGPNNPTQSGEQMKCAPHSPVKAQKLFVIVRLVIGAKLLAVARHHSMELAGRSL